MLNDFVDTINDNDTIWVIENKENSDPIFKKYVTDKLFSSTYAIVSKDIAYIFVHKLDEGNISTLKNQNCKIYIFDSTLSLQKYILDVLKELNFPKKMLLSYTTMSDENTDIISYSSYLRVTKFFRKLYKENQRKFVVRSAEMNIYNIISKNSNDEIEKLKLLAKITDEILKRAFYSIKPYQSEFEIAQNTKKISNEYISNIKDKYGIIEYDLAWDICPIVLVGENLKKGGHALPSNKKIKPGDTVYFDFGIKAVFNNGITLYTDMQRMGYLLKQDEKQAPNEVQKVFNALVDSIEAGINKMKPGVKAYKIDEIVRGIILKEGYPDYPHATGHPVGREVHAAGALISPKYSKRANLELLENAVYTLEPRVNIENGGSIEEMILITNSGAVPLCNTQRELYLI